MENMQTDLKPSILQGGILFIAYSLYFFYNNDDVQIDKIRVLGAFSLAQLFYIYFTWYKQEKSFFNGYIIFISAFYAFNLGQPILELFNMVSMKRSLIQHYGIPLSNFFEATYIGSFFILFLHIGALLSASNNKKISHNVADNEIDNMIYSIQKVAYIFCFISFPLYFYQIVSNISLVFLYGYNVLYDPNFNTTPKLVSMIADYYEPAVISLYFCAQYFNKNVWLITIIAFVTVFVPPIILGGRSNAMIIFSIFLVVYTLFHSFNLKRLVSLTLGVLVLFSLFAVIAVTRGDSDRSLSSYESAYMEIEDPVSTTFSEMGFSMYPLCECLDIFPVTQDYKCGDSFLYAFFSIIPNLGFWDVHPAKTHANLGEWLMDYLRLSFGPGFSLTAEAYVNFGYFGFLFFFFYGFILLKSFKYINSEYIYINPFIVVACLIFLWFSIKTVRNSFLGTVRAFFYYSYPMYILFKYYYRKNY